MERISRLYNRIFTLETCAELKALNKLEWPVQLLCIFENMLQFITLIFCGHLEEDVLSGVCLAVSYITVTGVLIGNGLGTGVDTLISQTFGARNKRRVGVIVQTSLLIFGTFCLPIWGLWLNAEFITSFIVKDRAAAQITGEYMDIYMPALPAIFLFTILSKYMENQEIVRPLIISGVFTTVMSITYNAVLIYGLGLGFKGAAIAGTLGNYTLALSTLGQIWWKKLHVDTWRGWSKDCFLDWGLFYRLAVPGLLMLCIQWWAFQAGTIVMSILGDTVLNAQGIVFQMVTTLFGAPFGLSVAACARVGIYLGSGKPEKAKFVTQLCFKITCISAIIIAVLFLSCTRIIGYAFTSDLEVIHLLENVILLYFGILIFFDWFQVVAQGIFRGCGFQKAGAVLNDIAFLVIALPIGISLAFMTKLTLVGYWLGILVGSVFQFFAYSIIIYKMDWKKQSELARERAGVGFFDESIPLLKEKLTSSVKYANINAPAHTGHLLGRDVDSFNQYGSTGTCTLSQDTTPTGTEVVKADRESVNIPVKTIISRVAILGFSFSLFAVGLVCRFALLHRAE